MRTFTVSLCVALLSVTAADAHKPLVDTKGDDAIPWAGSYNAIVGCNTHSCCCPKNYFNILEPVPLTLTLVGEMEGACGSPAQPFWAGNSTLAAANATEFQTSTGLPKGVSYRVEWSPGSSSNMQDGALFRAANCFFEIRKTYSKSRA